MERILQWPYPITLTARGNYKKEKATRIAMMATEASRPAAIVSDRNRQTHGDV